MAIELPIAAHAREIIAWLRTETVRIGPATIGVACPRIEVQDDRVLLRWESGATMVGAIGPADFSIQVEPLVEIKQDRCPPRLWSLLTTGRIELRLGCELVVPDLFGFTADHIGEDGVALSWPRGRKPRLSLPLLPDPTVMAIQLWPDRGHVIVKTGPDQEIVYT